MMDEIVAGRHAPPAEMELAHDAFSVAYVLVRSHADAFAATSSDEAKAAAKALVRTMQRSLEIPALSREAAVGAGVTLAAAAGAGEHPRRTRGRWRRRCSRSSHPRRLERSRSGKRS